MDYHYIAHRVSSINSNEEQNVRVSLSLSLLHVYHSAHVQEWKDRDSFECCTELTTGESTDGDYRGSKKSC